MIPNTPTVFPARPMRVVTLPVLAGHAMLSFTSVPNVTVTGLNETHNTANGWPEGVPVPAGHVWNPGILVAIVRVRPVVTLSQSHLVAVIFVLTEKIPIPTEYPETPDVA